jgi:hypothetical protein
MNDNAATEISSNAGKRLLGQRKSAPKPKKRTQAPAQRTKIEHALPKSEG